MYDVFQLQNDTLYALMSRSNDTTSTDRLNIPCSVNISPRMVLESATATGGSENSFR